MSAAILLATVIVAFVAGMVALAMPCCFTVLLPSYMAKSFATRTGRLGMTTIFGAGIATVLLPIAVGVSYLSTFITANHPVLFVVGGFFMIILGFLTLWGISVMPQMNVDVDLKRRDVPSVYALGVFGGVASSCCAPVLAGVLVLTVLSGTLITAVVVGLAYVVGMVFPLLVVAIAWDRKALPTPRFLRGRLVRLRLFGSETEIHSSKLVAGGLFIGMGIVTTILGVVDRMLLNPTSEIFGIYQASLERALIAAFSDPLSSGLIIASGAAIAVLVIIFSRRAHRVRKGEGPGEPQSDGDSVESPDFSMSSSERANPEG